MTVELPTPQLRPRGVDEVDVAALAAELTAEVRGEVRFDAGSRGVYSTDASNYRQLPLGVVCPLDTDDAVAAVDVCYRHGAPVLPRGGGTALAGQTCNVAVVLDFSKYVHRIVTVDPESRTAVVRPGVVLDRLREAAEAHGLTFGPDPATHDRCTLGGMIGNNSCGTHSVMAGRTSDNVEALEILTYDGLRMWVGATAESELSSIIAGGGRRGEIYRGLRDLRDAHAERIRTGFPDIPRRVSGINLDELLPERGFHVARALVGSEGTCVLVLAARVRLVHSPPARQLVVLGYDDAAVAADAVPTVMAHGPVGLEGFDAVLVRDVEAKGLHARGVAALPPGGGWLLAEFGGDTAEQARAAGERLVEQVCGSGSARAGSGLDVPSGRLVDAAAAAAIWKVRESGLGATARVPGHADTWAGWEDAAVEPARLGDYLRDLRALLDRYGYHAALYGHYGQACVHTRIDFDLVTPEGIAAFRSFVGEAADLVVRYGGSLSGEHGDGQARAALLPVMFGPALVEAFAAFKAVWDPAGRMNPGKVVDAYPIEANLRLGSDYRPREVSTHFAFTADDGDFARATTRCVGVGACRRETGGVMCPSYMATHEEEHSTRGRARLLFEMLNGEEITDGWRSEAVKDALDLCLACKGCAGECPVNVDMATYKAEFLAHHYAGRLRPPAAYSMGLLMYWLRLGTRVPWLVNGALRAPGLGALLKRAGGVDPCREAPVLAPETFRAWWRRRGSGPSGRGEAEASVRGRARVPAGERVLLWVDTFSDAFAPEQARAAVRVLEAAGFTVDVPGRWLCCGRPLYDFGLLGRARALLGQVLDTLGPDIDAGVPIVGLEPSCVSVFRQELVGLFPHDPRAQRLSAQVHTLGEFLVARDVDVPTVGDRALVQGHCHERSVLDFDAETAVLRRAGVSVEVVESSCCGMAGAFGFQAAHYDLAQTLAESVLLPAVRGAEPEVRVVADGFSCREMIRQGSEREGEHLAQVLASALPPDPPDPGPRPLHGRRGVAAGAVALGAVAAAIAVRRWRR